MSRFIVFTGLDGTLLDFESASIEDSRATVRRLCEAGLPLVFCSAKTFAEQQHLQERFGIRMPCIVENGSAVAAPVDFWSEPPLGWQLREQWLWLDLGLPAGEVRRRVRRVEAELGEALGGISFMDAEDVASLTGMDLLSARRAQMRDYSELLALPHPEAFWQEAQPVFAKHGLVCVNIGRFRVVVSEACGKGKAARLLVAQMEAATGRNDFLSVGLGDSPNDCELLLATDVSYQVMMPGREWAEIGAEDVVRVAEEGPLGWARAVSSFLNAKSELGPAGGLTVRPRIRSSGGSIPS